MMTQSSKTTLIAGTRLLVAPLARGERLYPAGHTATYPDALRVGATLPKWSGAHLLSWAHRITHSDPSDNLLVYDCAGQVVFRARVWLPGAYMVDISDAAASREGHVAAVGLAGTGAGAIASFLFLAHASRPAAEKLIARTSPFEGLGVAFGPDNSIWVVGRQLGEGRRLANAPDHAVLHRYSVDGKLLQQALPWSSFNCAGMHPTTGVPGTSLLVASGERIGLLAQACREWVELTSQGEVRRRQATQVIPKFDRSGEPSPKPKKAMGLAMTARGFYASFEGGQLYRLIPETGAWQPVVVEVPGESTLRFSWLTGSDGDSLVYASSGGRLVWARAGE